MSKGCICGKSYSVLGGEIYEEYRREAAWACTRLYLEKPGVDSIAYKRCAEKILTYNNAGAQLRESKEGCDAISPGGCKRRHIKNGRVDEPDFIQFAEQ